MLENRSISIIFSCSCVFIMREGCGIKIIVKVPTLIPSLYYDVDVLHNIGSSNLGILFISIV